MFRSCNFACATVNILLKNEQQQSSPAQLHISIVSSKVYFDESNNSDCIVGKQITTNKCIRRMNNR